MSTRDSRPGSTGGDDVPGPHSGGPDEDWSAERLATLTREQLDVLGARYDGVEVLHVDPGPEPGSPAGEAGGAPGRPGVRAGRRRSRSASSSSTSVPATSCRPGSGRRTRAASARCSRRCWAPAWACRWPASGLGMVLYTKKLLPHETAVQDKHDGSHFDRVTTGATLVGGLNNSGLARRKLITRSLGFMAGGLGLDADHAAGRADQEPHQGRPAAGRRPGRRASGWSTSTASPIRPGDQEPGSMQTVFPAVPGGDRAGRRGHHALPAAARAGGGAQARAGPGGLRLRRLPRVLEDLHARRLPGRRCTSSRPAGCSARATSRSS